ncbi:hypothetical protein DICVIV_10780 [Dictyocaulus viviparus]|uniref:Uncharacterized protein n=1 Tax=Dictyocaulus viviparus TaxID=29172 RepID=A0A0D8XEZ8_DICVI|nr:hypothetical protein DICVIV_10780 [Dictyocaulus viviparus]
MYVSVQRLSESETIGFQLAPDTLQEDYQTDVQKILEKGHGADEDPRAKNLSKARWLVRSWHSSITTKLANEYLYML